MGQSLGRLVLSQISLSARLVRRDKTVSRDRTLSTVGGHPACVRGRAGMMLQMVRLAAAMVGTMLTT